MQINLTLAVFILIRTQPPDELFLSLIEFISTVKKRENKKDALIF